MSYGTNFKLSFEGLAPSGTYIAYLENYDGYGGFNFIDMGLITRAGLEHFGYENTGYWSALHGQAEAFTSPGGLGGGYGKMYSVYAGETFNLKSGVFASAWDTSQPTTFWAYRPNGLAKAHVQVTLGQTATTIDFANYGNDFKHIISLGVVSYYGVHGKYGQGYQIAMDNLKVHWNGPIPGSGAMRHHAQVNHPVFAALAGHAMPDASGADAPAADTHDRAAYHAELASLVSLAHHGGGLASEFSLPQAEHFGL